MAAIQSIDRFLSTSYSVHDVFKCTNYSILGKIIELIREKSIMFRIYKVKGYSDDEFNDKVNDLAKETLLEVGLLKNRIINIDNISSNLNSNSIVKVSIEIVIVKELDNIIFFVLLLKVCSLCMKNAAKMLRKSYHKKLCDENFTFTVILFMQYSS